MLRAEKTQAVKDLKTKLDKVSSVILAEYRGLTVEEITQLKRQLRTNGSEMMVAKNRLLKIALRDLKMTELEEFLTGPNALVMQKDDVIADAKVLVRFAKEHESLRLKAGIFKGQLISKNQIESLAALPPVEVLRSRLCSVLLSPVVRLHRALMYNVAKMIMTLKEIQRKREAEKT